MTAIPSFIKVILDGVDISQREEINLEVGEKSPGGFDAATFKLCELEPPDLTAPIIIRDTRPAPHGQTIYTGRVEDVELGDDGYAITCNTGTSDRRLGVGEITPPDELSHRKTKFAADTPIMDIARYAMSRLLGSAGTGGGVYDSGHIIEFAGTLFEDSQDFAGQTFEDIMGWLAGLTSYYSTPLTWHIRNCGLSDYGCMYMGFEDTSARLTVQYNKTFKSKFSAQAITNTSTLEWGGVGQIFTVPEDAVGEGVDYSAIRVIRDRWVNAGNDVRLLGEAKALAYAYLSRFGAWRSVSDSITIDCTKDEKVVGVSGSPLMGWVDHPQEIDPWLVPAGLGCRIENIPRKWGRYATPNVKYLTERKYNFTTGQLTLTFGVPRSLQEFIKLIQTFVVNRPTVLSDAVYASVPLVDQDTTTVFGPSFSTTAAKNPSLTTGIPVMTTKGSVDNEPMRPGDGKIHPILVADEGLEANFIVGDLTTTGFKGAIRVIPGIFNEIEVLLGDDDGLVQDSCFIRLYKLPKGFSPNMEQIAELPLTQKRNLFRLDSTHDITLDARTWILPQIVTASTVALWASISLHAKKDFPGLVLK